MTDDFGAALSTVVDTAKTDVTETAAEVVTIAKDEWDRIHGRVTDLESKVGHLFSTLRDVISYHEERNTPAAPVTDTPTA